MEIGDVNNGEDVDLIMLSVSMNESISESDKSISKSQKYRERILGKLVTTCNFHNQNKESNICITCGISFCDECANKHKEHKIVKKIDIISYSDEIDNIKKKSDDFFIILMFLV